MRPQDPNNPKKQSNNVNKPTHEKRSIQTVASHTLDKGPELATLAQDGKRYVGSRVSLQGLHREREMSETYGAALLFVATVKG